MDISEEWDKEFPKNGNDKGKKYSKAESALLVAESSIKNLFVDESKIPHAAIWVNDHLEILSLGSRRFRNYLARQVYQSDKVFIDSTTLNDVIGILSAKAEFDCGDPIKLNLRIAQSPTGDKWYYDLTNKQWEFVEISSSGWDIQKNQNSNLLLFQRYGNQLPQAQPNKVYDPMILDKFINLVLNKSNVKEEQKLKEYRIILKCYIVSILIPGIPKPIMMPYGGQGAAKTTLMDLTKLLVDPSIVLTFSFPTDVNEFIQQLSHNLVAFYDNVSILRQWQSDQICRAVSGSGSSKRVLYSDDEDFIRTLMRCIGLNGINLAATNPDVLDRGIFFELKRIDEKDRRYVKIVKEQFEQMKPELLGYLFDILVKVKSWIEKNGMIELDNLPRMADWAGYCEIISTCMGYSKGEFIKAYKNNSQLQIEEVMETSLVANTLSIFMDYDRFNKIGIDGKRVPGFEGTATELKKELDQIASSTGVDIKKDRDWPKQPNGLIKMINILEHTLKEAGIEISFKRKGDRKGTKIFSILKTSSESTERQKYENHPEKLHGISENDSDGLTPKTISTSEHTVKNYIRNSVSDGADYADDVPGIEDGNQVVGQIGRKDPNQLEKCPDCIYQAEPFFMKIHAKSSGHGKQPKDLEIR